MSYQIEFSREARKAFKALSSEIQIRLDARIQALSSGPRSVNAVRMSGLDDCYRIRIGEYRVVYKVFNGQLLILVLRLGHRREVYRGL